jgi:peptidoglycan/LPS O-acetylase OafA/YrhL
LKTKKTYWQLDLVRGLAALAVVAGHLRAFMFLDFGQTADLGSVWRVFYFVTGLGHQAVIVFFVLSGFLVGGHVIAETQSGTWSWETYLFRRLTRLWVVLLPALFLTAFWDQIGMTLTGSELYKGGLANYYHSTPAPDDSNNIYTLRTFLGNAFFLQTIVVPSFGTNGPLWSLAYEFWYYILFPLVAVSTLGKRTQIIPTIAMLAGAALMALALPTDVIASGLMWLQGVLLYVFNRSIYLPRPIYRALGAVSACLFLWSLAATRGAVPSLSGDLLVGGSFALFLWSLLHSEFSNAILETFSSRIAAISFTMYLVHFPFAAALSCLVIHNERFLPSLQTFGLFLIAIVTVLIYSAGLYYFAERKTSDVQMWLQRSWQRVCLRCTGSS